jgi:hypothetical protein
MTRRTARPTLRVLRDDLDGDWGNRYALHAIERNRPIDALPLTSLDHPILSKAAECFGEDPGQDSPEGLIRALVDERFYEVKVNQWRAAVWIDAENVCWVVAAGLAKGDHKDREDFYQRMQRLEAGPGVSGLLPSSEDADLWKQELAHALLTDWHLGNQHAIASALRSIETGGTTRLTVHAPRSAVEKGRHRILAEVDMEVARFDEPGYRAEEVVLTVHEQGDWKGSPLANAFTLSLLACVHPPETDWDAAFGSYSNIVEVGTLSRRVDELLAMTVSGKRATPQMVSEAHYVHHRDLSRRMVEGQAARSICGIYFVPSRDPEGLPVCAECNAAYREAT